MNVSDRGYPVVIAEQDEDGFLVMFPDGTIRHFSHRGKVEDAASAWFHDHRAGGYGMIEWR